MRGPGPAPRPSLASGPRLLSALSSLERRAPCWACHSAVLQASVTAVRGLHRVPESASPGGAGHEDLEEDPRPPVWVPWRSLAISGQLHRHGAEQRGDRRGQVAPAHGGGSWLVVSVGQTQQVRLTGRGVSGE